MAIRDADPDARSSPLSSDEIQTLQHLLQRFQNSGNSRHCFNFYLLFSIFSAYRIVLSQMMVKPLSINMHLQFIIKNTYKNETLDTGMYTVQMCINTLVIRKNDK